MYGVRSVRRPDVSVSRPPDVPTNAVCHPPDVPTSVADAVDRDHRNIYLIRFVIVLIVSGGILLWWLLGLWRTTRDYRINIVEFYVESFLWTLLWFVFVSVEYQVDNALIRHHLRQARLARMWVSSRVVEDPDSPWPDEVQSSAILWSSSTQERFEKAWKERAVIEVAFVGVQLDLTTVNVITIISFISIVILFLLRSKPREVGSYE